MSTKDKRLIEALFKIAEIANSAAEPANGKRTSALISSDDPEHVHSPRCGCAVKILPERLTTKAADVATRISPVNRAASPAYSSFRSAEIMEPQRLSVLVTKYWGPSLRRISVSFLDGGSAELRKRILDHMNAWSQHIGVSFAETSGVGDVRITRSGGGYWSYLGTDILLIPRDRPTMNLENFTMSTRESEFVRVVRHETGHTLGFPHEHMRRDIIARIDREKAYRYFYDNQGWDRPTVDAQVLTPLDERSIMGSAAQDTSIMCYFLPSSIMIDGRGVPGGADITANDYEFAAGIYPKAGRTLNTKADRIEASRSDDDWGEENDVDLSEIELLAA